MNLLNVTNLHGTAPVMWAGGYHMGPCCQGLDPRVAVEVGGGGAIWTPTQGPGSTAVLSSEDLMSVKRETGGEPVR